MTKDADVVERATRMGLRALQVAAACLAVVILVLAGSLALLLSLTRQARADAVELQRELQCRSGIYSAQEVANSQVNATIAEALVFVARSEDIPHGLLERIDSEIIALRSANADRDRAVELCLDGDGN